MINSKYSSGGKWYIGYGTECDAEDYPEGITREEAELLLMSKVEAYEAKLNDFFDRYDVTPTQGQFDALICFSYNFGTGWMSGTSDLVKIARGELSAICRAVGVMQPRDSVELHNVPLEIKNSFLDPLLDLFR